ncbi:hypothetical protein ABZ424_29030 [Streptomyces sp. NPDC005790]|uniref:hypothetical protein n=1 Tax=Streptomyces sp. NPDC005790 TaxID=3154777 RepID=UPI00340E963F
MEYATEAAARSDDSPNTPGQPNSTDGHYRPGCGLHGPHVRLHSPGADPRTYAHGHAHHSLADADADADAHHSLADADADADAHHSLADADAHDADADDS